MMGHNAKLSSSNIILQVFGTVLWATERASDRVTVCWR